MESDAPFGPIVALAGGVGGAKLADGLAQVLQAGQLSVVVNTADDFDWYGLRICPDLDTVLYTLGGIANPETGWGIVGDSWNVLQMLERLGQDPWFRVGDRDLAIHVLRTSWLREGLTATEISARLGARLGVSTRLLPMADAPVATLVETAEGTLAFQDYFVRRRHGDTVAGVKFAGIDDAVLSQPVVSAIQSARAVVFCPSNPIVSIGPILAVPGMSALLEAVAVPVVAVSPIVGGKALKGPAADMLAALGHEPTALGVARIYQGLVNGMVIDQEDRNLATGIERLGMRVLVTQTVMRSTEDRIALAAEVISFAHSLSGTQV